MKSLFAISLLTAALSTQAIANDSKENKLGKYVERAQNLFVKNQVSKQGEEAITQPKQVLRTLLPCAVCEASIKGIQTLVNYDRFKFLFHSFGYDVCTAQSSQISRSKCINIWDISNQEDKVYDRLVSVVKPEYHCEVTLDLCNKQLFQHDNVDSYAERVLSTKPDSLKNDDYQDNLYQQIAQHSQTRKTLQIVQFTDLHLDLEYVVGSNKICDDPLCCRKEFGMATDPEYAAGPFGSVGKCDIPVSVLDKMTDKVNELAPDALFWTGDATPHDLWSLSQDHVEHYQKFLFDYMKLNLSKWRTFPLEGNHDFGQVYNSQDFDNTDPVIPFLADQWKDWLDENALKQFNINGFYTQKFTTSDGKIYDKVNVIAINTEAAYDNNFYLIKNKNDPGNQLAWLEQKLNEMEKNGETAILIGHHPVSSKCMLYEWSVRFRILMDRYQHIVRLSFFGHEHEEQYSAIRSWEKNNSVGTIHWSGSVTTFQKNYPSFRRFILDAETMLPVQIETYRLDPYAKNPEFVLDHELGDYYNLTDLSPASFMDLSNRFRQDEILALKYLRTKHQQGDQTITSCDDVCRLQVYCDTTSSTHKNSLECQGKYDANDFLKTPLKLTKQLMWQDQWYTSGSLDLNQ